MKTINSIVSFIHANFLIALLLAYALAFIAPEVGLSLRNFSFGHITFKSGSLNISAPLLMLTFLLLNAGLGIKIQEIKGLLANPKLVIIGFFANISVPILLIFLLRAVLGLWHNSDELQNLLTGLALIIAMPIAGSSTAWSQNVNGNISLSLGLVLLSTLTSPFITPIILHLFSFITTGDYSEDLQELASEGTNIFMFLTVVAPSLLGILLSNFILLLILNYSNAATSLPQAFSKPDIDYLLFILIVTFIMCCIAFAAGWLISKAFRASKADTAALMFGLGMNNNGTGLVFATAALSDHPAVLLPIVFYTLIQQIIAASIDRLYFQSQKN
jgi:BASS family bile acid:Na+ symporter